jgi:two-component system, sensor histidine kinase
MQSLSSELARSGLDAAPDAMIIIDDLGIVRFANRQASALFGYAHEQIVGQSVELLLPERFRSRHVAHRQAYFSAVRVRPMGSGLALFGRRQDGHEFPVEISLSPLQDSGRTLVAAAIRDVTDRKRVESELRSAREDADHAREAADRANQAKSRFLATASHDLRQPLQTLALLNGTLQRLVSNEDLAEALAQQAQAIGAMSRLLNTLLDISKLESGAIRPELTDFKVATLLEGLRREFASIAADKGLELRLETSEIWVHSDPSLVEQIMKNLVANAIKYTRTGRVLVRSVQQNASIRLDVLDTGIGIPAEQLAYIYDEFYQVGVPTNASREGYGLGLSIVQRIVKLLNLRLDVTSEVDRGSIFSLVLPPGRWQSREVEPQDPAGATSASRPGRARILLVEDDPAVRDATLMLLRVEGYRVTAVASLSEALRHVQETGPPELVITDYHLAAGELGTDLITTLRKNVGADIKAVLVTGDTSFAVKQMRDDLHLRVASKPINADELLALLNALLAR